MAKHSASKEATKVRRDKCRKIHINLEILFQVVSVEDQYYNSQILKQFRTQ